MHCQSCGAGLPVGANFCPNCGVPTRALPGRVPAPGAIPPIETCVINLRWLEGQGFVPARFEADVSGPGGNYIAGQSPAFNVIPGEPFWLTTHDARNAHAGLVTALSGAGWQAIGLASAEWWNAEFRRAL